MSHDAHESAARGHAPTPDEQTPAVRDAGKVLWIVLAGIVAFAAIVQLFVF